MEHTVEHPRKTGQSCKMFYLLHSWFCNGIQEFAMEFRISRNSVRIAFLMWYRVLRNVTTG